MRTTVWFRALITVWGLWFTAALSEAAGLHTCAMHGNHATPQAAVVHDGGAHAGHDAHSHASKDCTCLGLCCGASLTMPRATVTPEVISVQREIAAFTADRSCRRITRAHALPFANGPPRAI